MENPVITSRLIHAIIKITIWAAETFKRENPCVCVCIHILNAELLQSQHRGTPRPTFPYDNHGAIDTSS